MWIEMSNPQYLDITRRMFKEKNVEHVCQVVNNIPIKCLYKKNMDNWVKAWNRNNLYIKSLISVFFLMSYWKVAYRLANTAYTGLTDSITASKTWGSGRCWGNKVMQGAWTQHRMRWKSRSRMNTLPHLKILTREELSHSSWLSLITPWSHLC